MRARQTSNTEVFSPDSQHLVKPQNTENQYPVIGTCWRNPAIGSLMSLICNIFLSFIHNYLYPPFQISVCLHCCFMKGVQYPKWNTIPMHKTKFCKNGLCPLSAAQKFHLFFFSIQFTVYPSVVMVPCRPWNLLTHFILTPPFIRMTDSRIALPTG